jgi:peptidoglycan-associated lipoprotein
MSRPLIIPVVAFTLTLAACASRPPEPTADLSSAAPAPATAPPVADRGTAPGGTPSGSSVASSTAAPGDRSVYFEFDSSALSPRAQTVVQQNARYVQPRNPKVRLEGNADDRGSREYNLALGQRRAETVRQAMVLSGVRAEALEAISYGEERPRCTDQGEDCRATNRRVDILVTP